MGITKVIIGPWMFVQTLIAMHPIVLEIFSLDHSGGPRHAWESSSNPANLFTSKTSGCVKWEVYQKWMLVGLILVRGSFLNLNRFHPTITTTCPTACLRLNERYVGKHLNMLVLNESIQFISWPINPHSSLFIPLFIPPLSSWSMLARERASWTWVWLRPASLSPPAATTTKWRLLMLERSVTLPWAWRERWLYTISHTHTHTLTFNKEECFGFFLKPLAYSSILPHHYSLESLGSRTQVMWTAGISSTFTLLPLWSP